MTDPDQNNVLKFTPRVSDKPEVKRIKPPPMFNIPPATKYLTGVMIGLYFLLWISGLFVSDLGQFITALGGFISGSWTGAAPFWWWTPITPLTSILLHGSWMHIGMNALMLVAIGSGVEKWLGPKRFLMIFFFSSWIALLTHFAFSPYSTSPIVGASGGISGLFAAILFGMRANQTGGTLNSNMMPVIIIWIVISVIMGLMGSPDGSNIAWVAHIGGFLGGLGITHIILKKNLGA